MAASDADSVDEGDVDDDQPGFDLAADVSKMTEAQRRKWEKSLKQWRLFVDFLVRHISIVTYKYNCFEREELTSFMLALERSESLRMAIKLKKGETPKITSIVKMKESVDLLLKNECLTEASRIRKYIDLVGRLRGLATIAGGLFKALKRGKVNGLERIKYSLDFWKGFCVRSFDFTELTMDNVDDSSLNDLERRYMAWPAVIRTTLHLAQTFLRRVCDSTGLDLINAFDIKTMQKHMQSSEFIVATKMEEMLFQRVLHEATSFGQFGNGLLQTNVLDNRHLSDAKHGWTMPPPGDVDPSLLKPISDSGILLALPADPPKEKKRKKGRKGSKKGKKSAGRTTSHKSGKRKKK